MSIETLEDCLELLVGLRNTPDRVFVVDKVDYTILSSIGRQLVKGIPMTDRQQTVVKTKLETEFYATQFASFKNFYIALDTLRMPLREIDRSHWVKIIELNGKTRLGVRFPFNKKFIGLMETLAYENRRVYHHEKGTHVHDFELNEQTIYSVIKAVKARTAFEIQPELLDAYNKIELIVNQPQDYIPGVYNMELKNLPNRAINYIISDIGNPQDIPLFKFKDQGLKYGLEYFDQPELDDSINALSPLTQKVIRRNSNLVFVNSQKWSLNAVSAALLELDRFPLLIVLPNEQTALDDLVRTHDEFRGFIKNSEVSVMFRVDNNHQTGGHPFNQYIGDNLLNNKVGKNTKVVYISNTKYPKPVLLANWAPNTVLYMGSVRNSKVDNITFENDLVIHYDTHVTPMAKGFKINIENL